MKKLLILLLCVGTMLPAFCSNWVQVGEKSWLDLDTVTYKYPYARYWDKHLFSKGEKIVNNKEVYFIKGYNEVNCTEKKVRNIAIVGYDFTSAVIYSSDGYSPSEWSYIVPDTVGEYSASIVCGNH